MSLVDANIARKNPEVNTQAARDDRAASLMAIKSFQEGEKSIIMSMLTMKPIRPSINLVSLKDFAKEIIQGDVEDGPNSSSKQVGQSKSVIGHKISDLGLASHRTLGSGSVLGSPSQVNYFSQLSKQLNDRQQDISTEMHHIHNFQIPLNLQGLTHHKKGTHLKKDLMKGKGKG